MWCKFIKILKKRTKHENIKEIDFHNLFFTSARCTLFFVFIHLKLQNYPSYIVVFTLEKGNYSYIILHYLKKIHLEKKKTRKIRRIERSLSLIYIPVILHLLLACLPHTLPALSLSLSPHRLSRHIHSNTPRPAGKDLHFGTRNCRRSSISPQESSRISTSYLSGTRFWPVKIEQLIVFPTRSQLVFIPLFPSYKDQYTLQSCSAWKLSSFWIPALRFRSSAFPVYSSTCTVCFLFSRFCALKLKELLEFELVFAS